MVNVPGVLLHEEAISEEYAQCITSQLPTSGLGDAEAGSESKSASLQLHFFSPLPEYISMISEDVIPSSWKEQVWHAQECNSSIVQFYRPGEGIKWHTDLPIFANGIAILSLLSTVIMHFRKIDEPEIQHSIVLRPRSLLLFDGDAQYAWEHQIAAAEYDTLHGQRHARQNRISVTMRRVLKQ